MSGTCQICQQELASDAVARGQAVRAKGQLVCSACAGRLGIPADRETAMPHPRSPTEAMPASPEPAAASAVPAAALALGILALAAAGLAVWRTSQAAPPPAASAPDLSQLTSRMEALDRALADLKAQAGTESKELGTLAAELKEGARLALEESKAARAASEVAARALAREATLAAEKAVADRLSKEAVPAAVPSMPVPPVVPALPVSPSGAPTAALADQCWATAQACAQERLRQGRYMAALAEYENIPKKFRRADYEKRVAEVRSGLERLALERFDTVMKTVDERAASGDYTFGEGMLSQLTQDAGFPAVLEKAQAKIEELRTMSRSHSREKARTEAQENSRLVQGLVKDLDKEDPEVQRRAIEGLGAMGAEAVGPLVECLESASPRVRWGALMALARTGAPAAVLPVAKLLKDQDRQVRLTAADVLGEFNDPRAVPALIDTLSDADEVVGRQAGVTLQRITRFVPPPAAKPMDTVAAWRAWWESGRQKLENP